MKKTLFMLAILVGVLTLGAAQGFAYTLPTIDGSVSPAAEWSNQGYAYYLNVSDPQEAGIPDSYNIKSATLFQELDAFGFGDGNAANDGIYLLIETYAAPSLTDLQTGDPGASISMNADFNADGVVDLIIRHDADLGPEALYWRRPVGSILGAPTAFAAFGTEGVNFKRGSVLEYYIPTGTGGAPVGVPFPQAFIGTIVYDNGGDAPDDRVIGTLAPEPSTMILLGTSLLGLVGYRKRFGL